MDVAKITVVGIPDRPGIAGALSLSCEGYTYVKEYMFDVIFGEKINRITLNWVEDYPKKHSDASGFSYI